MTTMKCPYCAEEIQAEAVKCKHCGTWLSAVPETVENPPFSSLTKVRLYRSSTNKMWAGVCGGLAQYLGIDPTFLRVVVALATFFTVFVPGFLIYIILAMIVPSDDVRVA